MILILTWFIALAVLLGLDVITVLARWLSGRRPRDCGVAFDAARLGTRMSRPQAEARPTSVRCSAVSASKRLERLLEARAHVVSLGYFADRGEQREGSPQRRRG